MGTTRKPVKTATRKPAPKTPTRKTTSTALARRPAVQTPAPIMQFAIDDPKGLLPRVGHTVVLSDDVTLDNIGAVDLKLTPAEEAVLSEDVNITDMRIKPNGVPYLSHPVYTRWFNRAFGRLGWSIRPASRPQKVGNMVCCHYQLFIHGHAVAVAMGEQEYLESNRDQSYGDAYEATVASALRRLAKRLGVGLEMWDREFLDAFKQKLCVRVKVQGPHDDKPKWQWRRKVDPELPYEISARRGRQDDGPPDHDSAEPPRTSAPPRASTSTEKISPGQISRFWAIAHGAKRTEAELRGFLRLGYGIESTSDILRKDYDAICAALERPGQLVADAREPGQEG